MLDGLIHLDLMLNFGKRPAPGIWGHVADAMAWILKYRGIEALLKWVDDFVFFRYPKGRNDNGSLIFSYNNSLIWFTAAILGWLWAPSKFVPFSSFFKYIGFLWHIEEKTIQLPKEKKEKCIARLAPWVAKERQFVDKVEELIRTLNHIALVVPTGKTRLINLFNFCSGFKSSKHFIPHSIPAKLQDDITWWNNLLH